MHKAHTAKPTRQQGFTLIELSIVLVIIGLIVGGILVGQDLIKAAEIRATIAQSEKYNSAVNTFRSKYNGIPGDLLETNAVAFGLCPVAGCTGATTVGLGDGNGLIQDATNANLPVGEPLIFWQQLSVAGLVDGAYGTALTTAGEAAADAAPPDPYLPPAKMGRGNYWHVGSANGFNYYLIGGDTKLTAAGAYTFALKITPIEAYDIDVKIDDGAPNTGIVQARKAVATALSDLAAGNASAYHATGAEAAGDCQVGSGSSVNLGNTYSVGTVAGNTSACMLRIRFN